MHRHQFEPDTINEDSVLYVSGPMSGIEDFNFPMFQTVVDHLRARGIKALSAHEVVHEGNTEPGALTWEQYLRGDIIAMLQQCNAIILLPRWYKSRGAQIEAYIAHSLNWPMFFWRDGEIHTREGEVV